jgi:hypothetical protein
MKKRYSPVEQWGTVSEYLLGEGGRRHSEAAVEVSRMGPKKLRGLHKDIRLLLDSGDLERRRTEAGWRIFKSQQKENSK